MIFDVTTGNVLLALMSYLGGAISKLIHEWISRNIKP